MIINKNDKNSVIKTAQILKNRGVVIIPTDTVYGFSGIVDEYDEKSICKNTNNCKTDDLIREIKGRSETKPLIQLISSPEEIVKYTDDKIPENLIKKWPGALTIIVNLKKSLPFSKILPSVAFRCPGDQWLRKIIKECGKPIYSTSVNKSGYPVLETVEDIKKTFESQVELIVDDGEKKGALPSTLVKIEDGKIVVLRQGSLRID